MEPLKLTDVIYDCLITVFEKLDVFDLLHIAEANGRLVPATQSVFSRRHREKTVFVNLGPVSNIGPKFYQFEVEPAAVLCHHFGKFVSKMFINFMYQYAPALELEMLTHCTDSMIELRLGFCHQRNFEAMKRPWPQLQKLEVFKGTLGSKLSELNSWFPKIIGLKLVDVQLSIPKSFVAQYKELKILTIYNKEETIEPMVIFQTIQANPQLQKLVLISESNMNLLRLMSEHLLELVELEICAPRDCFYFEEIPLEFKRVKKFKLNNQFDNGNYIRYMPFAFDDLQELKIVGFNEFTFDAHLMNFILSQESIEKIAMVPKLQKENDLDLKILNLLVQLPKLIELEICMDNFTNAEVIFFLIRSKRLKKELKIEITCSISI